MSYIIKPNEDKTGYYINDKGIFTKNIEYHKKKLKHFTTQELIALENYIKAENYDNNGNTNRF